jgi:hypothetical protein
MLALMAAQFPSEQQLSLAVPPRRNRIIALRFDSFGALLSFCREFFAGSEETADLDSAAF